MTDEVKGLNKNATKMLTGFIFGTIAMGCIMYGGIALLILLSCIVFSLLFFVMEIFYKIMQTTGCR